MPDANDMDLVWEYATRNSEPAFETLVRRYVSLVYSVALRQTGNPAQAEEITQAVFLILARKAARLRSDTVLAAWLHETARFASASFLRGEMRRRHREQEAYVQSQLQESTADPAWEQLAPLLDEAIGQLGKADRDAVVLRFFQDKSAREIAAALNVHESAAQKRLNRAVEKLRAYFLKRGVTVSAGALIGALSVNSVHGAPAHLAASVMAVSAKGTAVSTSTLTLIKGALKIMAWTKAKTAIVAGASVLLAAGTATVTVKEIQHYRAYPWQVHNFDTRVLDKVPPQVTIVPARFSQFGGSGNANNKMMGLGIAVKDILLYAYGQSSARTIIPDKLPPDKFDFIANLPSGNTEALQKEIKRKLGLVGRRETLETDVLLLKFLNSDAPGLQPADPSRRERNSTSSSRSGAGEFSCRNEPLSNLAGFLEGRLKIPVIDQTGITNHFDMDLKWKETNWQHPNLEGLKQALLDQLGLELVPGREPVEMLVVEKAGL
jgi:uncharacterized protein (TIGR03435 family)